MSSNKSDMINPGNYEEYFILYMDNELGPQEKLMVEAFLAANPDLQAELNLLMSTKLPVEEMTFNGKQDLFAHEMKMQDADESLMLYIDDEVTPLEKKRIEEKLKTDKAYQVEHNLLMKSKLDKAEVIAYPNKKELYRSTAAVVSIKIWMRIAAAIVIVLFAALFFISNSGKENTPTVADNSPEKNTNTIQQEIKKITSPVVEDNRQVAKNETTPQERVKVPKQTIKTVTDNPVAQNEEPKVRNTVVMEQLDNAIDIAKKDIKIAFNNPDHIDVVTKDIGGTSRISEDPAETVTADGQPERQGSFRGFLRKATRLIERRAGIGTASDDELLIGAVAIKLK